MTYHINPSPAQLGAFKGPPRDAVLIACYPAVDAFLAMIEHSENQKEGKSRQATVKASHLIRTSHTTDRFA